MTSSSSSSSNTIVVGDNVLDSWEDAVVDTSASVVVDVQLERRQRQVQLLKRQCDQQQQQQSVDEQQQQQQQQPAPVVAFRILRRPQSDGRLCESTDTANDPPPPPFKQQPPTRPVKAVKTFEERQAAYAEARERIFGEKYQPDDDADDDDVNGLAAAIAAQYVDNDDVDETKNGDEHL